MSNDSIVKFRPVDNVECCFDIVAVFGNDVADFGNNVERNFVLSTKSKEIKHGQFVSTLLTKVTHALYSISSDDYLQLPLPGEVGVTPAHNNVSSVVANSVIEFPNSRDKIVFRSIRLCSCSPRDCKGRSHRRMN